MTDHYQTWEVTEPYVHLHDHLGEGPYYEEGADEVRWVDIARKQLHTVSVTGGPGTAKTQQLDVRVTVTADIEGVDPKEKILIGAKFGIAILDRKTGQYEYVARFVEGEGNPRTRSNDGAADPHGRFWLGTMTDFDQGEFQPEGSLVRFDWSQLVEVTQQNITIPNSVGWSPDGSIMYFTQTEASTVFAWDYSASDGSLSNQRVFYKHEGTGGPDGFRIDVEGNMWHAIYGESRVIKISPQGKLIGEIKLPTRNITCTQFVGTELFITTASDSEGDEKSQKYGGALYRVDVGITGVKPYKFKLQK